MIHITFTDSPLGKLGISAEDGMLVRIFFDISGLPEQWIRDDGLPVLADAASQLSEYFGGKRKSFDLPFSLDVSPFADKALRRLCGVPYGEYISYGELAERAGRPGAARAVGNALRKNPLPIVIPCHRVVPADGSLGGYAYGAERKLYLLSLERRYRHG